MMRPPPRSPLFPYTPLFRSAKSRRAGVTVNEKIYARGGEAAAPPLKVKGKIYATIGPAVSTVEVYDPATNTWSAAAPMPTARSSLTAATVKGKIYAIGGADRSGHPDRENTRLQSQHPQNHPSGLLL